MKNITKQNRRLFQEAQDLAALKPINESDPSMEADEAYVRVNMAVENLLADPQDIEKPAIQKIRDTLKEIRPNKVRKEKDSNKIKNMDCEVASLQQIYTSDETANLIKYWNEYKKALSGLITK